MKSFFKRMKEKWNAYLERMAETNKELYGDKRLDCCGINKSPKAKQLKNQS